METVSEVAQFSQSGAQLAQDTVELGACGVGELRVRGEAELELQRDRDESLLRAVVEVAFDLTPCPVGSLEDASA
jgi:hypothetical protein